MAKSLESPPVKLTEEQAMEKINALEDKVYQLEIHQAYQDEHVEQLSQIIGKQQMEMDAIKHQLTVLSSFLKNFKSELSSQIKLPSEETPPPHY